MSDLVDRSHIVQQAQDFRGVFKTDLEKYVADMFIRMVDHAPSVDAVPVVHGRWERCGGDLHSSGYAIYCTVCNKVHFVHRKHSLGGLNCEELFKKPKYCPSCGAVMEREE